MELRKKIGLLLTSLYNGGAEKVAADLSIYFSERGYDVIIFITSDTITKKYPYQGIVVYVPGIIGLKSSYSVLQQWNIIKRESRIIKKLKRQYGIDVTISFSPYNNLQNILSRYHDKVILTIHNITSIRKEYSWEISYKRFIFKLLYPLAYKTVAVSKYSKMDLVVNMRTNPRNLSVINNPIMIKTFIEKSLEDIEGDDKEIILAVGRFDDVKQQWHLIRGFNYIHERCPAARLYLLGKGPNLEYINGLIRDYGLTEYIKLFEFQDNVAKYMRRAKVLVSTSASESFPCTFLEALCMGLPIVANDCPGGIREIIADRCELPSIINDTKIVNCGILTPILNGVRYCAEDMLSEAERKLAEGILQILNNNNLRKQLSSNCRKKAKRYDMRFIGKQWLQLIEG